MESEHRAAKTHVIGSLATCEGLPNLFDSIRPCRGVRASSSCGGRAGRGGAASGVGLGGAVGGGVALQRHGAMQRTAFRAADRAARADAAPRRCQRSHEPLLTSLMVVHSPLTPSSSTATTKLPPHSSWSIVQAGSWFQVMPVSLSAARGCAKPPDHALWLGSSRLAPQTGP